MKLVVSRSEITLGEQVTLQSGYAFSSELFSENGVKLITPKNFTKTGRASFTVSNTKYTTEGVDTKYTCKKGDLLMLLTDLTPDCRLLGKPVLLETAEKILLNQRIVKVNVNNDSSLDKGYLLQYLLTDKWNRRMRVTATGTTVRHSSNKIVLSTKLVVPSIQEQQKIASFLSKVDEKISLLTKKKDKLTEYKKGVMQQLFNGKWDEQDGQLNFIPPTLRFAADDGSNFPDWREVTLDGLAEVRGRVGWKNLKQSEYTSEGPYLIAGKHINEGVINWRRCDHLSEERYVESIEIALQDGDVIFSKDGSLGNPALIENLQNKATINGTMMLVRVNQLEVVPSYFFQVLRSSFFDRLIALAKSGSSIPHIFQRDMKNFEFPLPSLEEQTKIASFLSAIDQKVALANSELEKAKEWKKGLLQQMFV